ncbi:MAG: N-acetyltransferase [Bacteroidales bacterium]|nr:N-acetyltransferase [Bacteroidales bacterium]
MSEELVYLRPIVEQDTDLIVGWRNSDYVRAHSLSKKLITPESHLKHFREHVQTGHYRQFIVERSIMSGVVVYPIATVYLKDVDMENKRCELCVFTSADQEWIEACQVEGIRLLIKKAFDELGMHKVYTYVFCKFPEEVKLLEKAGLQIEARLNNEARELDGSYSDIFRMSITNE